MLDNLFRRAFRIIDASGIPEDEWAFGGGTVVALRFRHRESVDVDVFLSDAQLLTLLSPRLNEEAAAMTGDYVEMPHFVKLRFPEGEIDFIIAPCLTEICRERGTFVNREAWVETPEEVVIKKLFYRAESLKVRDVLDVAVVYREREGPLLEQASLLAPRLAAIERRWEKLRENFHLEIRGLKVLDSSLAAEAPALFEAFVRDCKKLLQAGRRPRPETSTRSRKQRL